MPDQNQNYFRQVALLLISLTIITMGVVYNQVTTPPSQAQFPGTSSQKAIPQIPTITPVTLPQTNIDTTIDTPTDDIPAADTQIDTGVTLPEATLEDIWLSLQFLNQLTKTPYLFAYDTPEINLPGISAVVPVSSNILLDTTLPSSTATTVSPATQPTDNEVIAVIKDLTGYSQWEKFKTNFRTAREQYAGTGKCMIDIQGLGCLVEW